MGAANSKGRPGKDREGDAVVGPGVAGEHEGDQEDDIGSNHSGNALPPGHPKINQATSEVVGGHPHN